MSDVDISAEAVEMMAEDFDVMKSYHSPGSAERSFHRNTAATLRALRAALDAAEDSIATLTNSEAELMAGCDDLEAERDAALARAAAAWRAGVEAAIANIEPTATDDGACDVERRTCAAIVEGLRFLAPPSDPDAATREAVAAEREACAEILAQGAIRLISNGRARVSQVDQHIASVLRRYEELIRARAGA